MRSSRSKQMRHPDHSRLQASCTRGIPAPPWPALVYVELKDVKGTSYGEMPMQSCTSIISSLVRSPNPHSEEPVGVLLPQQQARLQWLQQIPAGHVCSPNARAALWLCGAAVFAVIEED